MQSLFAIFQRLSCIVRCLKTHRPPGNDGFSAWKKKTKNTGIFRKGAPPFVPGCQPPVRPPNSKQFGLAIPYNLDQARRNPWSSPWLRKNDLVWVHSRCVCLMLQLWNNLSKEKGFFLKKYNFTTRNNFWWWRWKLYQKSHYFLPLKSFFKGKIIPLWEL